MAYTELDWQERIASRVDVSGKLVHLTKGRDIDGKKYNAIDVLIKILREKTLMGSSTASGFVVGNTPAACFFDAPLYSVCENLHYEHKRKEISGLKIVKYEAFGLMLPKPYVFRGGGRPVIYERTEDAKKMLPKDQWWRIVNMDLNNPSSFIDWSHEREWRFPGNMTFHLEETIVIVPNEFHYNEFYRLGAIDGEDITKKVSCVIPIWLQYL